MCAAMVKVMCTTTIPLRGARALIGHVAQNLLFLLNLFVQIEQIKNPISVLVLMRKSRRSRNFFVQPAQKFSTMLIDFVQNREIHICATYTKTLNKKKKNCAKQRKLLLYDRTKIIKRNKRFCACCYF